MFITFNLSTLIHKLSTINIFQIILISYSFLYNYPHIHISYYYYYLLINKEINKSMVSSTVDNFFSDDVIDLTKKDLCIILKSPMGKQKKKDSLNPAQIIFCHEYLKTFNAARSYKIAYPKAKQKSSEVAGHNLLRNIKVQVYLAGRIKTTLEKSGYDADSIIAASVKRAFFNIKDFVESYSACGVEFKPLDQIDGTLVDGIREKHGKDGDCWVELDLPSRDKALDRMAIMLGLLKNTVDLKTNGMIINIIQPEKTDAPENPEGA